jgi:hypothetical protein
MPKTLETPEAPSPEFDLSRPLASFVSALRAVTLSPRRFFVNFRTEGGVREAAVFALLVGAASGILSVLAAPVLAFLFESEVNASWGVSFGLSPLAALGFALLSPLVVAAMAAVYMLSVRTFIGKVGSFREMYRISAYAYGAMILAWIPVVGAFAMAYSFLVTMGVAIRFVYGATFMTALVTALTGFVPMALLLTAFRGFAA